MNSKFENDSLFELFLRREHCILIILYPEVSQAVFLDSSRINDPKKQYVELKEYSR
jgi:hypothetical protein